MHRPPARPLLAALAAAALALPAAAQDWSGRGRLNGVVTDEAGKPIADATIRLRIESNPDQGPPDMKTDKRGKWSYLGLLGGQWTVKVVAADYVPSEGIVKVNEFQPNPLVSLKLRKMTPQDAAAGGDPKLKEAQAAIDRGDALLRERNAPAARAEFEKALPLLEGANQLIVRKRIATCQMVEGDDAGAIVTLEGVLAQAPDDQDALRLIIDRLIVTQRGAEAEQYMARMPAGAALDPNTVLNLGINLYNDNKLPESLAKFEQVIAARPDWADGYYYRGLANLGLQNTAAAKVDFEKVLSLDPNHPNAELCREFLKSL